MKRIPSILLLLLFASAPAIFAADDAALKPEQAPVPATVSASTPSDPNSASMPKFPLVSPKFQLIDDNTDLDNGMPDATGYDMSLMLDLVTAIKASSQEHLKANVDREATFKKMFNHPSDYRGHVVQFESTVKFTYENGEKLTDSAGNKITLARGHLSSSYQLITFLSVEPLPPGLKPGDSVLLTGVFVQRFAYVNRKTPGVELTWTPLILCKRLEPFAAKVDAPVNTAWIIGYILFSIMAVGLFLAYKPRMERRTVRENIFRKMKVQRDGKDRLFPKN